MNKLPIFAASIRISARVDGWDIIGKTGTTDSDKDSWFCGLSPYASLAIWTGFDTPRTISVTGQRTATTLFSDVMGHYLSNKKHKDYVKPSTIVKANYSASNGSVYNVGEASEGRYVGYYNEKKLPKSSSSYVDYYAGGDYYDDDDDDYDSSDDDDDDDEDSGSDDNDDGDDDDDGGGSNSSSAGTHISSASNNSSSAGSNSNSGNNENWDVGNDNAPNEGE